ncbi:MAG: hypothetical protein SPI12_03705 [Actinomycetaceae bacterium]|nr:hypothetical protein [Actinomycetaceae bacterium]MDY6082949.1 hypothetical protein [Actinomycetaceae bacterium]
MATNVYKTLLKIVGVVLALIGIGAMIGGNFASGFVKDQLKAQQITMPDASKQPTEAQGGDFTQADVDALKPFSNTQLDSGPKAKAYADNYIAVHMRSAAKAAGVPEDKQTFAGIGEYINETYAPKLTDEIKADQPNLSDDEVKALVKSEPNNKDTKYEAAKTIGKLDALRTNSFFEGNMLRGTLLSAYGWGLIGTIAIIAAWVLIVLGVLLFVAGFVIKGKKAPVVEKTTIQE